MRRVWLAALAAFALLAVLGGGSFTDVTADRGAQVNVVDDPDAYLGLDGQGSYTVSDGDTVRVFTVSNQFPQALDSVTASAQSQNENLDATVVGTPDRLGSGDSGSIDVRFDCPTTPVDDAAVDVTVTVTGAEVRAERDSKRISVTCNLAGADTSI